MILCVVCGSEVDTRKGYCTKCGGHKFITPPDMNEGTQEITQDYDDDITEEVDSLQYTGQTEVYNAAPKLIASGKSIASRYKIIEYIKSGGMGAVYKAEDTRLLKTCAIKELINTSFDPDNRKSAVGRFEREARILSELRHSNLPRVTDYFTLNDRYYLAMDYIDGEDLTGIMEKRGKKGLSEKEVIEWTLQICDVLDYLHSQNPPVIYRDIKPSNIMLRKSDNRIMLIDFGIARTIAPPGQESLTHTAVGTVGYMAPEQFKGKAKPASDIYSLGATMYHLLTGKKPLPLNIEPLRTLRPDISPRIEAIVTKAVNMMVKKRFATVREMKEAIEGKIEIETIEPDETNEIDVLLNQLNTPDPNIRYIIIKALNNYVNNRKAIDVLSEILEEEKDVILKREAANILSQAEDRTIIQIFNRLINDRDWQISLKAVQVASKFKDPSSAEYLMKALSSDSPKVQVEAAICLAEMKDYRASKEIFNLLQKQSSPDIQKKLELAIDEIDPTFLEDWKKTKTTEEIKKETKKNTSIFIYGAIAIILLLVTIKLYSDYSKAKNFSLLINKGKNYFSLFDFNSALKTFEEAATINPSSDEANCQMGRAYMYTADMDKGELYLKKALELNKDNAETLLYLGRLYILKDNYDEAVKLLEEAVRKDPGRPLAHIYLGEALYKKGEKDMAKNSFKNALNLPSEDENIKAMANGWLKKLKSENIAPATRKEIDGYLQKGEHYICGNMPSSAIDAFQEVIKINEDEAKAYYGFGSACASSGNTTEALENFQKAIECDPTMKEALCETASLYLEENNYDKAIKNLGKAILIDPIYPDAHYLSGLLYYKADKKDDAGREFNIYLKLAPLGKYVDKTKEMMNNL